MTAIGRDRKRSRSDRYVPFVYWGVAIAIGVAILPSALRPPREQPTQSGAFSPDAPPDKRQQSLFSSFKAASSGTPGGQPDAPPPGTPTTVAKTVQATVAPPVSTVANACPFGFGKPPRQIESVYSPACAPAFVGSNGGSTAFGVTGDSINVCYVMSLTGAAVDGPVPAQQSPSQGAQQRTYTVLMQYFNSRYQFYGRQLHFFYVAGDGNQAQGTNPSAAEERARGDKAKDVDHCFAAIQETSPDSIDELARRGIFTYTLAQTPEPYFGQHDPYLWSFTPSGTQAVRMGVEYYCKKLAGKPPGYTVDSSFKKGAPRKVGLLVYNPPEYENPGPPTAALLKQECGLDNIPIVTYTLSQDTQASGLVSDVVRLHAAGVTTIFYLGDLISAVPFSDGAASNNYYPEWFLPGFGGVDTGHNGRNYNSDEWKHAFGFSWYELPKPDEETECYKAYHEIDPNNDPDSGMCIYLWGNMVQLFGGMQEAGAHLTVDSLRQALLNQPHLPPNPPYHMAGGYGPTEHTYPEWASEIWYDPTAIGSDGQKGTYIFPQGGKRYTFGQWNAEDNGLFKSGITLAPT